MPNDVNHSLVCPFLNESSDYAHGVEFGMLHERMERETQIKGYHLIDNQEQITLYANKKGWTIEKMEITEAVRGWFYLEMHDGSGLADDGPQCDHTA